MKNMNTLPTDIHEISLNAICNSIGASLSNAHWLTIDLTLLEKWIDDEVASGRSTEKRRQEWEDLSYYAGLIGLGEHSNFQDLVQTYADKKGFSIQDCGADADVAWIVAANAAVCAMEAIEELKSALFSWGEPDITEDLGNRG
tara:strand:+ start:122 stop:550 length:429 start_codon:yes stop_codon:yes gene_type:complete